MLKNKTPKIVISKVPMIIPKRHFPKLFDGKEMTMSQIITEARASLEEKAGANATVERTIKAVPAIQYLTYKNAVAKRF